MKASGRSTVLLVLGLLPLTLALVGCGRGVGSPSQRQVLGDRPLHLPHLAAGARCPVSAVHQARSLSGTISGPAIGPGPVYPILFSPGRGALRATMSFDHLKRDPLHRYWTDPRWFYAKMAWLGSPRYSGPVLIRGGRLDSPGWLRSVGEPTNPAVLALTLHVSHSSSKWWDTTAGVFVPSVPGCYAFQLEGTLFSFVVVFRAVKL